MAQAAVRCDDDEKGEEEEGGWGRVGARTAPALSPDLYIGPGGEGEGTGVGLIAPRPARPPIFSHLIHAH